MLNKEIYSVLNYTFKDETLIETALTHKSIHQGLSYKIKDNERLEFIGDAFLDAVIGFELFKILPDSNEGELTKKRAYIVCEKSLADIAKKLELNKYMHFGYQAISNKVNEKDSVLSDCVEAIIGAIYLDSGYDEASKFILNNFKDKIYEAINENVSDYKSDLQEYIQSYKKDMDLKYVLDKEVGPDHDKKFFVHVEESGEKLGSGFGKNKKSAEQMAAKESLETLKRRK